MGSPGRLERLFPLGYPSHASAACDCISHLFQSYVEQKQERHMPGAEQEAALPGQGLPGPDPVFGSLSAMTREIGGRHHLQLLPPGRAVKTVFTK